MRHFRLPLAALAVATLAACSDGANPAATMPPAAPRFDGGGMFGSGHRNDTTAITTAASTTTATDTTGVVSRGGGMVGSGN